MTKWFTYIIRCCDDSLYTGVSNNLQKRIVAHNSGNGARYTRTHRPVRLVWSKAFTTKSGALKEESRIKKLDKFRKEEMLPWSGNVSILKKRNEMLHFHSLVCPPLTEKLCDSEASAIFLSFCQNVYTKSVRDFLINKYSYGTPTEKILRAIQDLGPIVEIGAGSGYWAWLLKTLGADVVAYDQCGNISSTGGTMWAEVKGGGPKTLLEHQDRALFLCWPPVNKMASLCLDFWKGDYLAYVGDPSITADNVFHHRLHDKFELVTKIYAPSWPGIMDSLTIWNRR